MSSRSQIPILRRPVPLYTMRLASPSLSFAAALMAVTTTAAAEPLDYRRDVQPILAKHCYECHGPDKQESGLRLDTAAAAKGARPRKKGKRLPGMTAWAENESQPWTELSFDQFGLHATLLVKTICALYYTAGGQRLLTIVLVRDSKGKRPDQMFYCTCLDWDARTILSHYSCRWSIEVTFEHSKQLLGLEDPANRLPKAVERTAPMALLLYSLTMAWFHRVGDKQVKFPDRPWYTKKSEPSFGDALTTLRRLSCLNGFRGYLPRTGILENSGCPSYRIYQPRGLTDPPRDMSRESRLAASRFAAATDGWPAGSALKNRET